MSHKTPMVAAGLLREPHSPFGIAIDTPEWFNWLAETQHQSFHYAHAAGDFTARKERKQRGDCYWVAYRQRHGKLFKVYLGKTANLTGANLDAAAIRLAQADIQLPDDDAELRAV